MKLIDDTVYKCDLLSITPDIVVYRDKSKKKNIGSADVVKVKEILVQPTFRYNYMKEIITNRNIPIYRIQKIFGYSLDDEALIYRYPPKIPCFISFTEEYENEEYRKNDLKQATFDEVREYLENNNLEDLDRELEFLFAKADKYYQDSLDKQIDSDEAKIKQLLRFRKK